MAINIRRNDTVMVLTGKDSGKTGRVLRMIPKKDRAVVEGVHFHKRHTKPNPSKNVKGGIVEREGPIHVSNLLKICVQCKKPTRLSSKVLEDGRRVRACRRCGAEQDK